MNRFSYYSPIWIGALIGVVLARSWLQQQSGLPPWQVNLIYFVGCPLFGVLCQLFFVGTQGAFAQVLPVPGGRSIRGRAAVVAGALLMSGMALGGLAMLSMNEEGVGQVVMRAFLMAAGAALLAAIVAYLWALPLAAKDFPAGD